MVKVKKEYKVSSSNIWLALSVILATVTMSGCNNSQRYTFSDDEPMTYTESKNENQLEPAKQDERFVYETSIEADLNNKYKADVYVAKNLTIEQVKDIIVQQIKSPIESIDTNIDDDSVVIVTERYYIVIYKSEDNETLVQVSEREYVYNSRKDLYRSPLHARSFYRDYYYYKCYKNDHNKFNITKNAFDEFVPSTKELNIIPDTTEIISSNKETTELKDSGDNNKTNNSDDNNKTNDNYINKSKDILKDSNSNNIFRKKSSTTKRKSRRRR